MTPPGNRTQDHLAMQNERSNHYNVTLAVKITNVKVVYIFIICSLLVYLPSASARRQRSDLCGLRVKLSPVVTTSLTTQR